VSTRRWRAALTTLRPPRCALRTQGKTTQVEKGHESKEGGFHINFKEILVLCARATRSGAALRSRVHLHAALHCAHPAAQQQLTRALFAFHFLYIAR
jgi:hypothetical protein